MVDGQAILAAFALAYMLGSVPFGIVLTVLTGAGDLRSIGSGNIGATNVLRTGRKGLAAATLLLDMGKGLAAVLLVGQLFPGLEGWAAIGAVIGHCFPVWLKFRGGKGVATAAGVVFGLGWPIGLAYAATWIVMVAITRISSLGGILAAVSAPLAAYMLQQTALVPFLSVIAALVIFLHRGNLARIANGSEPRLGKTK